MKSYAEGTSFFFNLNGYFRASKAAVTAFRLVFSDIEIFSIINLSRKRFLSTNFSFLVNFYYIVSFFSSFINYRVYFLNSSFNSLDCFERFFGSKQHLNVIEFFSEFRPLSIFYTWKLVNTIFSKVVFNYYRTNTYSQHSKIMALCASKTSFANFSLFNN